MTHDPSGDQWVWGIDPSFHHVAIACVLGDSFHVETVQLNPTDDMMTAHRLAHMRTLLVDAAKRLADEHPPLCVWVEQPSGPHPNLHLTYATGVIIASFYSALELLYPYPVSVFTCAVASWRKAALGRGNAKKHEVVDWATTQGYTGSSVDEAEALGIATGGAAMLSEDG